MILNYLKVKSIRQFVKTKGRRVGKDYLDLLNSHIQDCLEKGCQTFNGSKITLDQYIAIYTGLARKEIKK